MEKRLLTAAALSVLVLVIWTYLFPQPEPKRPPPATVEPAATATAPPAPEGDAALALPQTPGAANAVAAQAVEAVIVETDLLRVELTNRGGGVRSYRLRDYTIADGSPVELFPQAAQEEPLPLWLDLDDAAVTARLNDAIYQVEREPLPGDVAGEQVTFRWADGAGLEARKTLVFRQGQYVIDLAVEVIDRGRPLPARILIGPGFSARDPEGKGTYYYDGQALWNARGTVTRLKKTKLTGEPGQLRGDLRWAGFEDQYFTALVLTGSETTDVRWRADTIEATGEDDEPELEPLLAVSIPGGSSQLFVGPKKFTLLRELGHDLDRAVWFASNFVPGTLIDDVLIDWIARHIFMGLLWIHDHTIQNYGMAIILATVLLRLLLFPVNQFAMVSMKKTQLQMQRLQPKVKAIKAKYKKVKDAESRTRMNQEMMEMYRREGVNPMGGMTGCLPLLAQLPILIGFYNMLTVAIELRGAPFFGWINDLARHDRYWVLPILMGATMFAQQKMAMNKVTDPVQQQQQRMMLIMPVVFTFICLQMPSGMVLYWFVNNLLGIAQQWLVNRHTERLEAAAQKA